jgi:mono/diheme cytochrome c family protein
MPHDCPPHEPRHSVGPRRTVPRAPGAAAEPDAAKIFAKTCALCHGPEGQPNETFAKMGVRSFKDPEWQKATADAQLEKSIREGKKGTLMASFEKQFTPEEIKALVAYVRTLGAPPAAK